MVEIVAAVKNGRFPKVEIGEIIYGHLYDNDGPVHATISEVKDDNKTVVQSVSPNEMGEFQLKVINPDNKLLITSPNHQQVRQPIRRTFYNIQMWKLVPIESLTLLSRLVDFRRRIYINRFFSFLVPSEMMVRGVSVY